MSFGKIDKSDYKFVGVNPDPDFNYERNKKVIEDSIKKNEARVRLNKYKFNEAVGERGNATASYLLNLQNGRGESSLTKYFGSAELSRLRGLDIMNTIRYGQKKQEWKKN